MHFILSMNVKFPIYACHLSLLPSGFPLYWSLSWILLVSHCPLPMPSPIALESVLSTASYSKPSALTAPALSLSLSLRFLELLLNEIQAIRSVLMLYSFVSHHKRGDTEDIHHSKRYRRQSWHTQYSVHSRDCDTIIMSFFLVLPLKSHYPRYPSSSPLPLPLIKYWALYVHQYGKLMYDKIHVLRYVRLGIDEGRLTYG